MAEILLSPTSNKRMVGDLRDSCINNQNGVRIKLVSNSELYLRVYTCSCSTHSCLRWDEMPEHPSETGFHNEDGNPASANLTQADGRSLGKFFGINQVSNSEFISECIVVAAQSTVKRIYPCWLTLIITKKCLPLNGVCQSKLSYEKGTADLRKFMVSNMDDQRSRAGKLVKKSLKRVYLITSTVHNTVERS